MTTNLFREEPGQRFRPKPWQPPLLSRAPSGLAMGLFSALAATALVVFATTFRFTQKEPVRGYLTPGCLTGPIVSFAWHGIRATNQLFDVN